MGGDHRSSERAVVGTGPYRHNASILCHSERSEESVPKPSPWGTLSEKLTDERKTDPSPPAQDDHRNTVILSKAKNPSPRLPPGRKLSAKLTDEGKTDPSPPAQDDRIGGGCGTGMYNYANI